MQKAYIYINQVDSDLSTSGCSRGCLERGESRFTYELVAQLRLESDRGFEHCVLIVVYIEPQQQEQ